MQKEIITSILEGKDTLGILPTGGGKSLTFQVPGLIREGVVVVVTPLISLMKDQVDNLRKRKIQAVYFHSGMSMRERNLARERLFNNKAKFLYVSPERLAAESFLNEIRTLKVSFIVVDEAHCISQWGYDFRPSYLKVNRLRKLFPDAAMLALTASATKDVAEDICRRLSFRQGYVTFRASVYRDNLSYVVRRSEGKLFDIHHILSSVDGSAIVYVRSRKKTREIAEYLNNSGMSASFYHAGLDSLLKEERQNAWKEGQIRVMVATNAFGMGIDKADVRIVIHYDMPPSLEEYYQEAGRAGRDGLPAYAVLLTTNPDKATLRRRVTMEFPPREVIKNVYTRACVFSNLEIGGGYDRSVEFDLLKFCNTYGLNEAVVRPALRILGQAGYVEFIEEFENSSRFMVIVDREELYRVKLSSSEQEKILSVILRNYPGVFTDYVFINEKKIAYLTQLDSSLIYERLVEMSKMKVIHYIPRRKTPLLYFPTAMEEERYVEIGKNVYEDRIEVLRKRIESMIEYGFSEEGCRQQRLRQYFGEKSGESCERCDYCRQRNKSKHKVSDSDISEHLKKIFREIPGGLSEEELLGIFRQHSERALSIVRNMQRNGIIRREDGIWKL